MADSAGSAAAGAPQKPVQVSLARRGLLCAVMDGLKLIEPGRMSPGQARPFGRGKLASHPCPPSGSCDLTILTLPLPLLPFQSTFGWTARFGSHTQAAVGKSSVVLRFVQNEFQVNKEPTSASGPLRCLGSYRAPRIYLTITCILPSSIYTLLTLQ